MNITHVNGIERLHPNSTVTFKFNGEVPACIPHKSSAHGALATRHDMLYVRNVKQHAFRDASEKRMLATYDTFAVVATSLYLADSLDCEAARCSAAWRESSENVWCLVELKLWRWMVRYSLLI